MASVAHKKQEKPIDRAVSFTISMPSSMHAKVLKRARVMGVSKYIQQLVEADQ